MVEPHHRSDLYVLRTLAFPVFLHRQIHETVALEAQVDVRNFLLTAQSQAMEVLNHPERDWDTPFKEYHEARYLGVKKYSVEHIGDILTSIDLALSKTIELILGKDPLKVTSATISRPRSGTADRELLVLFDAVVSGYYNIHNFSHLDESLLQNDGILTETGASLVRAVYRQPWAKGAYVGLLHKGLHIQIREPEWTAEAAIPTLEELLKIAFGEDLKVQ